ncbi:unnamed protein product [Adineta steineri]|uniref:Uncharacterized protein n=1 Tax=Adineta steineri TaxID=433720 RepID=A0A815BZ68_9BILA|nr:unnamed protein product [Adineta steineri]CAF4105797.1 unnamed protein product [Adineta steineri]
MKLRMINYDDSIRNELRSWLEEDIEQETSLITLSRVLLFKGDYGKSEKYNKIFLKQLPFDDPNRAAICNNLGYTYLKMNKFADALDYLNTSIDLYLKPNAYNYILNLNDNLACAYNNKGLVLMYQGEFTRALECTEKSLELRQDNSTLDKKRRDRLAVERSYCHENLGLLYKDMTNYDLSLYHLQKTLDIRNEKLPSNHYLTAQIYNNLSRVYLLMNKFSLKTFEYMEQALIKQIQSLPDDHPHRGSMYSTLGEAYYNQAQYSLAFSNFERALHIYQSVRTRNPLLEAVAFSNMGSVMKAQEDFDGALTTFLQALAIIEHEKPHHPDVVRCLVNIGSAYRGNNDRHNAMIYFDRGLKFCQSYLTEDSQMTAVCSSSLASVLNENEYDLAMEYCQRAITIYEHIGLPNHPSVVGCHKQRGHLYRQRGDPHSALTCYEKALFHCREASLSQRHSLWVQIYTSCAYEYNSIHDYHRELEGYEHALQHMPNDSLELPRIHKVMTSCRKRIIEADVRQTIMYILDKITTLIE